MVPETNAESEPLIQSMTRTYSPVRVTSIGDSSLAELGEAVRRAQNDDPFTRVVVIADHRDVATALRHHPVQSGSQRGVTRQ